MRNPWGLVQGVALSGMVKLLVVLVAHTLEPDAVPMTASLATTFLRPVWAGEELEGARN
jgi:hypothetical protein